MAKIGDRVGAIRNAEGATVYIFGFGVYIGEEVPVDNVKFFGISLKEMNMKNSAIKLDNGKKVYGCECWWGSEEQVKKIIAKYKNIVVVDIEKEREGE